MDGTKECRTAEAPDQATLVRNLHEENLYCYEIQELNAVKKKDIFDQRKINLKFIVTYCRQLGAMLAAGVLLSRALDIIYDSAEKKTMKKAIYRLREQVQEGESLSRAMKEMGRAFPSLLIYMTETGETSGTLDVIMEQMAEHYEQEIKTKGKVRTAMIYPCILAVVAIVATTFMLIEVLPRFVTMFSGIQLPWITRKMLELSSFLQSYGKILAAGIVCLFLLFLWGLSKPVFRIKVDKLQLSIPIVGKLLRTIYTSRFATTFSILYGSGIDVLMSLEVTAKVLGNSYVEKKLGEALEELQRGRSLSVSLESVGIFTKVFLSMVVVGEESGSLENVLRDTGKFFDEEASTAIAQMVALMEPAMIVVMGGIIGTIVLSIMIPIFSMYGQML